MARLTPRKRTIVGGTLAVGLIVGIWLSGFLPQLGSGLGLGTGGDTVIGKPETSQVSVNASLDETEQSNSSELKSKKPKPAPVDVEPLDDVLTILVEDRHYAVWKKTRTGNGFFPSELSAVVTLAMNSKPNDDGLRVRILRSESARVTAWQKLQQELVQAGIPAESILMAKDLVK